MNIKKAKLNEIKDYIIKKYPNSCLACNYTADYYDEQLMEECEDFFYYEKLNWYGFGSPEEAKRVIRDYLKIVDNNSDKKREGLKERFGAEYVYDNELLLCFSYTMDAAEFTEHGSSIGGAWISEEGKMFLWLLEHNKELDD